MERLTKIDGCSQNDLIRCFDCSIEKAGANLENCGFCKGFQKALDRLVAYEDTGLTPEQVGQINDSLAQIVQIIGDSSLDRLRELSRAEKEGRLVVLPIRPAPKPTCSNTVYRVLDGELFEDYVLEVIIGEKDRKMNMVFATYEMEYFELEDFGKTAFLTQKEAEKALEGSGHD